MKFYIIQVQDKDASAKTDKPTPASVTEKATPDGTTDLRVSPPGAAKIGVEAMGKTTVDPDDAIEEQARPAPAHVRQPERKRERERERYKRERRERKRGIESPPAHLLSFWWEVVDTPAIATSSNSLTCHAQW